jgi:hypothetical protein
MLTVAGNWRPPNNLGAPNEAEMPIQPGARPRLVRPTLTTRPADNARPTPGSNARAVVITERNGEVVTAASKGRGTFVLHGATLKHGSAPMTLEEGSIVSVNADGDLVLNGKPIVSRPGRKGGASTSRIGGDISTGLHNDENENDPADPDENPEDGSKTPTTKTSRPKKNSISAVEPPNWVQLLLVLFWSLLPVVSGI